MLFEKDSTKYKKVSLDTSISHEHQTINKQCIIVYRPKVTKQTWLYSHKSRMQHNQGERHFRGHLQKENNIFFNINCSWLTWIKLINSRARITWLLCRLRSSGDRTKQRKTKREQITDGIISVIRIPKMMERLNGVSNCIFFYLLISNEMREIFISSCFLWFQLNNENMLCRLCHS